MTEATGAHLMIAALSSALLAVLGVDYYALLWGVIGAVFSLLYADPMGRWRAIAIVVLSSFIGAAVGSWIAEKTSSRSFLIVASLVCAAGAQHVVAALLQRFLNIARGAAGEPPAPPPAP